MPNKEDYLIEFLNRLSDEPDPAVLAERQQRMLERLAFRAALLPTIRRGWR